MITRVEFDDAAWLCKVPTCPRFTVNHDIEIYGTPSESSQALRHHVTVLSLSTHRLAPITTSSLLHIPDL
jgi:hypothetical protein